MEIRQLSDPWPKVWQDDADIGQPVAVERTERNPTGVDAVLEGAHLGLDLSTTRSSSSLRSLRNSTTGSTPKT